LRAEERVRLEKDEKGKTVVVPVGWVPICEKRFMYDMTASFLLDPAHPGIPQPIKLQEQHRKFFPAGQLVTRESGRQLALWAAGGAPTEQYQPTLEERARDAAEKGDANLRQFWNSLTPEERRGLKPLLEAELKPIAAEADRKASSDVPFDDAPTFSSEPRLHSPAGGHPGDNGRPTHTQESHAVAGGSVDEPAGELLLAYALPPRPTLADLQAFADWVDAELADGETGRFIRAHNETTLRQLKAGAPDLYDAVQGKLGPM
jgi:hypothetical protein